MIGIVGYGFVGQAYAHLLLKNGIDVRVIDPKFNTNEMGDEDSYIICVPTPMAEDGSCDANILKEVIKTNKPLLIKSTISLEVWKEIGRENMSFSPEFLRANNNIKDIDEAENIYISRSPVSDYWVSVFSKCYKQTVVGRVEELITFKYFVNSFLATKVSFFNQIFDYCQDEELNFETVRRLLSMDKRIGEDHSFVTEERGWGGHCFPKDLSAITKNTEKLTIIEHVIEYNSRIRK